MTEPEADNPFEHNIDDGASLMHTELGSYGIRVAKALDEMSTNQIVERIWRRDHTVWKENPRDIENRLGWLTSADTMKEESERLAAFAGEVRRDGYTHALLLGMGGSSLAPELFMKTFGVKHALLDLAVVDSTDPQAVSDRAHCLDPTRTLIIVSTKSGSTVETLSFFKYFYNWVGSAVDADRIGRHFAAITDPESKLLKLIPADTFRAVFLNDPHIGGRFSALSYFGLVPAALIGVDLEKLLERARRMARNTNSAHCAPIRDNPGALLGAILGELARAGRDKLTLVTSPGIAGFGDWVEQLVAESTGKEGNGILPVVGESLGAPDVYGNDRLFVHLRLEGDGTRDAALSSITDRGHPMVRLHLKDLYDVGGQFFLWEIATAVAGSRLRINPFDQPDVESAKIVARETMAEFAATGIAPPLESIPLTADSLIFLVDDALAGKPSTITERGYVAIQAYVKPTPETDSLLNAIRTALRDRFRIAVTVGYGPRYLHSTGQLHKGDAGLGRFVQIVSESIDDVPIPDEIGSTASSITFGMLKKAQAFGDGQALRKSGRQVISFGIETDVVSQLQRLLDNL